MVRRNKIFPYEPLLCKEGHTNQSDLKLVPVPPYPLGSGDCEK